MRDWIEVNGVCLRFDLSGAGPTVVLVHEMGGSLESWDGVLEGLQGFKVLRYDQRGSGLSEKGTAMSLETLATDLLALLDALDCTAPVVLGGAALGAALCMHFALAHPHRTRCLVVSSPAPGGADTAARTKMSGWIAAVRQGGMRAVTDAMLEATYPSALRADGTRFERHRMRWLTNDPESFMATIGLAMSFDLRGQLANIRVPTLVIGCLLDSIRPAGRSAELAALIPGSLYVEAPSGHFLPLQHPPLFAAILEDFLQS